MHTIKDSFSNFASGEIVAGYRDIKSGKFTPVIHKKNLITFGGADVLAKLISGDNRYAISGMYFKFQNTNDVPSEDSIDRSDNLSHFLNSSNFTESKDWLRVPIITTGKISQNPYNSSDYSGNRVTFVATSAAVDQVGEFGNVFSSSSGDGPSKVFSLALVSMVESADKTKDVVFARTNITPIIAVENSYIDVFWTVTFN
jgi:hypothetical protein